MSPLSKYQISAGRRLYGIFSALNSASFTLVTGNIIVVYAMYLKAGSVTIGLITAFNFLSFFALPLGKMFVRHRPIMRVYASSWVARNASLLVMLPIPFFVKAGMAQWALPCVLLACFGFNFFRGIGMVANNPVISDLAPGKDRGSFLVFLSVTNNTAALITTLLLAFALRFGNSLVVLNAAVITGIVLGFVSSFLLYKMPSSDRVAHGTSSSFYEHFIKAVHDRNFRIFIAAFWVVGLAVGMSRPFIIVYCREVYEQPDSIITFITFFTTLGALCMGLMSRVFIDKIGAKPMYLIFTALSFLSLIPAAVSPVFASALPVFLFLSMISFVSNLGFSGEENAGQTYFFGLVPPEAVMNMSIVYFLVSGASGAAGSLLGGIILEAFKDSALSAVSAYRLFFVIQIAVIAIALYLQLRLKPLGSYSLKEALPLFFSLRDIRGLSLLYKLDRSRNANEQTALLNELCSSNTAAAASNLAEHLNSPRFTVKSHALKGIESLPALNAPLEDALINETIQGSFTTAAKAAHILGMFKVKRAAFCLEKSLDSPDYLLSGEAMVALALMGETKAQTLIARKLADTGNAYVLLSGIHAMEIYANAASVPVLLDILRAHPERSDVQHEVMLALASVMGIGNSFYPAYCQYIESPDSASVILHDLFDETAARKKLKNGVFPPLIGVFLADPHTADEFCRNVHVYAKQQGAGVLSGLLIASIHDTDLIRSQRFRFFLCFWVIALFAEPKLLAR